MTANSGGGRGGSIFSLDVRQIVIAGILGGIAIFLGATQFGFIPVPNVSGRATILHIPAIVGGALEGPVVGALAGLIFGIFSWLDPIVPPSGTRWSLFCREFLSGSYRGSCSSPCAERASIWLPW